MPGLRSLLFGLQGRVREATSSGSQSAPPVSPGVEPWEQSQEYELDFWVNHWPHRACSRDEILAIRHRDAEWFLSSFRFRQESANGFPEFRGRVLEVGCGPVGFFESVEDISVLGIDTLMRRYAERLLFSRCGSVGHYEYSDVLLENITECFDFVVCSNVLDHTGDWQAFLRHLVARVRKNGGGLLVFTHSRRTPHPGHTQVFSPAELLDYVLHLGVDGLPLMRVERDHTGHGEFENYLWCRL